MRKAIINGIGAGIANVLLFQVAYWLNPGLFVDYRLKLASMLIFIPFMIWGAAKPALIDIKKGIQVAFVIFIIGNGIYYLYYYLQMTVVDPDLVVILKEEMAKYGGEKLPVPEDFIVTEKGVFFLYIRSLIGGFILAAMVGAFLNRR